MTVKRIEIARKIKGSLMDKEDWWYLCYDPSSDKAWIEHEWDHMNAYKISAGSNSGTSQFSIDEWIEKKGQGYEKIDVALQEAKQG